MKAGDPNADGTFSFMFGYMNENWTEQPDVAVGDNNFFSPRGSRPRPTNPFPCRAETASRLRSLYLPIGVNARLVWTLNVNGVERKAYATLKDDYLVDNMVIASETGSLGAGTSSPESRANIARQ